VWRFFRFRSLVTAPIPSTEPKNFAAGETVEWTKSIADYASTDGWSLIYSIRGPTVFEDVTATPNSDGSYSVLIAASVTQPLQAGTYQWAAHAYKVGPPVLRYPVGRGVIVVTPNLGTAETVTTHAARMLTLIEAALEGRIPAGMEQYQIGGRQITKIPTNDLYALRAKYRSELAMERKPGRSNPTRKVTFVNP
jgi:hypothetical protein